MYVMKSDELLNTYRKAYKTQNTRMNRNKHIPKSVEKYENWLINAQKQLARAQAGEITLDEFKESIKDNKKGD